MKSLTFAPVRATLPRGVRRARSHLVIQNNTLWSLAPKGVELSHSPHSTLDLTGIIGTRRLCSVGARDYASKSLENVDLTVLDHGGLHLIFEAEGTANPVDSPSVLYVTDVDSECDVRVGDTVLKKGERMKLNPGATIQMGEGANYVVLRNVHAHA
ncbi:hypothetical protein Ndes2526B_g08734 [Nannochloris sp. 'desiccata']|nr:hypothetical protein KSW81_001693 [Chlorella desiccata (nom. nud.)]KAH7616119.1 hypothetical protein NADE_000952 [Chlorella desiccata (nom. nud.)]KAH7616636.1 hypothetical protein NADE_001447 [Chlorella desiccata (nom. nud.)]